MLVNCDVKSFIDQVYLIVGLIITLTKYVDSAIRFQYENVTKNVKTIWFILR